MYININIDTHIKMIISINIMREVGALPEDPSREGCGVGNPEKSNATCR